MRRMIIAQAALAVLALTASAPAQAPPVPLAPLEPEAFVRKATRINLGEVEVGALASRRSTREEVQRYGLRLAEDQRRVARELLGMAAANKWDIPEEPDPRHRALAARLTELRGPEFDRLFLTEMVRSHQEALRLFETQAEKGEDTDVARFARKMLPTMRAHLKMARALLDGLGAPPR